MLDEISARCTAIEECYEFMLAYAGQGLAGDEGSQSSGQVRDYLNRAVEALSGTVRGLCDGGETRRTSSRPNAIHAFLAVLDSDARDSLAAIQLVLAQPPSALS